MNTTLPTEYTPACAADFVGPARGCALLLEEAVRTSRANDRSPIRVLINGRPGIGKSALVKYLLKLLGAHPKWSTFKFNGTSFKIDTVERVADQLLSTDLFSDYRVLWIEEADAVPSVAQIRMLTLLDDLPRGTAVVLTSNCRIKDFEERMHTRLEIFELTNAPTEEVEWLLAKWPQVPAHIRKEIAVGSAGNVRLALTDLKAAIQAMSLAKAA